MTNPLLKWIAVLVAVAGVAAGVYWWRQHAPLQPVPLQPPVAAAPAGAPPPAPAPAEPAIRHPIEPDGGASATARPLPPPARVDSYVADALAELMGRTAVLKFLSTDRFVSRVVATVDNLDRPHAAARLWPVNPAPGRLVTAASAGGMQIAAENAQRHAPLVQAIAATDSAAAAALYRRLYPMFQQAYVDLGYPGKYFNDRLVQVIDHLLATPEPAGPLQVRLTEVKGPLPSATPWLRYEFEDPALEARSAGQKILLRVGPAHARQLKAKLVEWRALVATAGR